MPRFLSMAPRKIAAIVVGFLVAMVIIAVVLVLVVFPPGIAISPASGASEINPQQQSLEISASHWGASIASVSVMEKKIAPDGSRDNGRIIEGHLQNGKFVAADGSNPLVTNAEYTVTVSGTVKKIGLAGISDKHLQETSTFTTLITPMPVVSKDGLVVRDGQDLQLKWNVPISSFNYQLDGVKSTSRLSDGGRMAVISLARFEQGKTYALTITAATSKTGVQMNKPVATTLSTPAALGVSFSPADSTTNASTDAHPTIVFSEPVSNPQMAGQLVSVNPKVAGSFTWSQPNQLAFVPAKGWDHFQDVTIMLKGGAQAFHGVSSGFVDGDKAATFTTAPAKSIDVNVSTETVTLLENGNPIESYQCASGAVGSPTPLGDFTIYAKIASVDMRGPGYFAPHVPWVMVFDGDYTMHGNYWATVFGVRSSHGCVGLPVATAHHIFNWVPLGTSIHIHE